MILLKVLEWTNLYVMNINMNTKWETQLNNMKCTKFKYFNSSLLYAIKSSILKFLLKFKTFAFLENHRKIKNETPGSRIDLKFKIRVK